MAADSHGPKNEPQYAAAGAPADAADLTEVAAYAAKVGNRKVGLASDRAALTGADLWNGLEFFETDSGSTYEYNNGWVFSHQLPTGWTNLTLATGWTNMSGYAPLRARVNAAGQTEVQGQILPKSGYAATDVFATVPWGGPSAKIEFVVVGNNAATRIAGGVVIDTNGNMNLTQTNFGACGLGQINYTRA